MAYEMQKTPIKLATENLLILGQAVRSNRRGSGAERFNGVKHKKIWIYGLFCLVAGISTVTITASASQLYRFETALSLTPYRFFTGFLVMWMAAGFCMLEAGLVRSKIRQCSALKT
ncbi:MAG: hypothetical protein CM15mP62_34450 [Rhodospirillaceae bacterium]|nr:MAG: hypothetical protein CM15mP62_34450 [Rhodospirillaceae bacterium]